jgi:hypothetical protein
MLIAPTHIQFTLGKIIEYFYLNYFICRLFKKKHSYCFFRFNIGKRQFFHLEQKSHRFFLYFTTFLHLLNWGKTIVLLLNFKQKFRKLKKNEERWLMGKKTNENFGKNWSNWANRYQSRVHMPRLLVNQIKKPFFVATLEIKKSMF